MPVLFQVLRPPGGSLTEPVSHRSKTPDTTTSTNASNVSPRVRQEIRMGPASKSTETIALPKSMTAMPTERVSMVMNPSELRGETVAPRDPNNPKYSHLKMPKRPDPIWDIEYDGPIKDPYYDDPNYRKSPRELAQTPTPTTPGRLSPTIGQRVEQGLSVVQGVDGAFYLMSNQPKTVVGVTRSVGSLYNATNTIASWANVQGLTNVLNRVGPYAQAGLGAMTLFTGQGWNSVQGATSNINTGLQIGTKTASHFTSATSATMNGLNMATKIAGGVMGAVGAAYSAYEIGDLLFNATWNKQTAFRGALASAGLVLGVSAAAGMMGLTGVAAAFSATGFGAPIGAAIFATIAAVTFFRGRKVNQTNKVDDAVLTELRKGGIENLGHEKYRGDDKWTEVFRATDEFAKVLPGLKDEQGKPILDSQGQPYTMESFKNASAADRANVRKSAAIEVAKRIDAGQLDTPGASEKDKKVARDRMMVVAESMSTATRDIKEAYEQGLAQAPADQKQAVFKSYVETVTAATREVIGDKNATGPDGKMNQGAMKRPESTKTQWDWMQVEFAEKAAQLGIPFAADWATPPVDAKKYQELKKKESKKGFDKLEGGDKLDIKKYEWAQKSQGQPIIVPPDAAVSNPAQQLQPGGTYPIDQQQQYQNQYQVDPYAQYDQGQTYPGSQTQRVSTKPKLVVF